MGVTMLAMQAIDAGVLAGVRAEEWIDVRTVGPAAQQPAERLEGQTDDELIALLAARDRRAEAALAALYDRYSGCVYGLGLRMLREPGSAEHLVQETFYRVWLHAARYTPGRVRFATWLLHIARNVAISELRAAARRPPAAWRVLRTSGSGWAADSSGPDALPEPADPADVSEQVWMAEQRRVLQGGLARLPAEQRQALELAYFGGLTHREIAAVQGAPLSTVKTRLAMALRKLARHLTANGILPEAQVVA